MSDRQMKGNERACKGSLEMLRLAKIRAPFWITFTDTPSVCVCFLQICVYTVLSFLFLCGSWVKFTLDMFVYRNVYIIFNLFSLRCHCHRVFLFKYINTNTVPTSVPFEKVSEKTNWGKTEEKRKPGSQAQCWCDYHCHSTFQYCWTRLTLLMPFM